MVLPGDVLVGDEPLKTADRLKCYEKVDPSARDEGAEYEGETKTITLTTSTNTNTNSIDEHQSSSSSSSSSSSTTTTSSTTVSGYVYDIGPASCQSMRDEVGRCNVLLSWGTVGACEMAPFQNGQRALVESSVMKKKEDSSSDGDGDDGSPHPPQYTLIIGDSTVEWYARINDADGEVNGDLAKAGRVAYMSRESSLFCGIVTGQYSRAVVDLLRREPLYPTEMMNNKAVISDGDEEDDDDDEEDEDEEED